MKTLVLVSLLCAAFLALLLAPAPPKKKTEFSLEGITRKMTLHPEWAARPLSANEEEEVRAALSQPYRYLGAGGQCHVFSSADEKYVIKFFKQKAFAVPAWVEKFPLPFLKEWLQRKKARKREAKRAAVFSAFVLCFDHLFEETGLLYVHLNPTTHLQQKLALTDRHGKMYECDLDELEFVVQRRADMAFHTIDTLLANGKCDEAKRAIDQLLALNVTLYEKGFRNRDSNFRSNCGFIGSRPIVIDVGRVVATEKMKSAENLQKEFLRITPRFRRYLQERHPELVAYFDQSVAKITSPKS